MAKLGIYYIEASYVEIIFIVTPTIVGIPLCGIVGEI